MRSLRRRAGGGEVGAMQLFPDDCIIIFFYCYFVNQTLLDGVLIDLALYWHFSLFSIVMGGGGILGFFVRI